MKHIRLYEDFVNEAGDYRVLVYTNPALDAEPMKGASFDITGSGYTDSINDLDGDEADTAVIIIPKNMARNQKAAEKLVQKHYKNDFDAKWIALR